MPPPRVTICTGRGHSVAASLQATQLVKTVTQTFVIVAQTAVQV